MVTGLDTFRRYFSDHNDSYVLIGGAACDLWFSQAGIRYRNTKDFDVVLCVEVVDTAFADLRRFVAAMATDGVNPRDFKVAMSKDQGLAILAQVYSLGGKP